MEGRGLGADLVQRGWSWDGRVRRLRSGVCYGVEGLGRVSLGLQCYEYGSDLEA